VHEELKLVLPQAVAPKHHREPQSNIPATRREREEMLRQVRSYCAELGVVPPIPLAELRKLAEDFIAARGIDARYLDFTAVLLNNELWRETLATIPYERRLLLLPKCLRVEAHCPAPFDEFGLLCKKCGMCSIQDLQTAAERLGYAVLVAEGSPVVMAIIETGKIDAIIGVSCLSVLERAFPYMEAAAVPGIAIPLLQDDCKDTTVDEEWIWDVIHLTASDKSRRMDLAGLRDEVDGWFAPEFLAEALGSPASETERIGHEWLARAGKRWRPFLTVAIHQALRGDAETAAPAGLRRLALAVECFHKASLIHDDIEDQDEARYGEQTLHEEHGVPIALNIGDYLLGEGYRLIGECDAPADVKAEMLRVASQGHRSLCLGQGAELCWTAKPVPLASLEVLEIFRRKTAPAFEVALRLGSLYAAAGDGAAEVLASYSRSLGIAYQIRDDLEDLEAGANGPGDIDALRPTLPLALAYERARAKSDEKKLLERIWKRQAPAGLDAGELRKLFERLGVESRARELLEAYKEEAIRSLWDVDNPNLKGLLRRVIGKIFNDAEIKGWCHEFEARNAAGREAGASPAA
jgi:geranylgeranyl diphosphate synthase type II